MDGRNLSSLLCQTILLDNMMNTDQENKKTALGG